MIANDAMQKTLSHWEAITQNLLERVHREIEGIEMARDRRIAILQSQMTALEESLAIYREMKMPADVVEEQAGE